MLAIDEFWTLKRSIQKMAMFRGITDCQFYLGALNKLRNPAAESKEDYWDDLHHGFPDLNEADAEEYLIVLFLFHHDVHVRPKGKERLEAFNQLRHGVVAPNTLELNPAREKHYKSVLRELLGSEQRSNDWHSREGRVDAGIGCVHARKISDTLTRFAKGNGTTRNPLISKLVAGNLLQVLKKARGIIDADLQRGGKVTLSDYERMYFNWTTLMSFRGVTICATCFPEQRQGFSALYEDELITRTGLAIVPRVQSPIKRYVIGGVPEKSVNVFKQQANNGVTLRAVPDNILIRFVAVVSGPLKVLTSSWSRTPWSMKPLVVIMTIMSGEPLSVLKSKFSQKREASSSR